ncbi:MAG TPA: ATP-binding protein [Sphingomicrobium sp.]|nr:ATP-binding protein [Sphingomicrobium sp.]
MDEKDKLLQNIVQLSRLALLGERRQLESYVRRLGRTIAKEHPDTGGALLHLVTAGMPMRRTPDVDAQSPGTRLVPVDQESRWDLLRIENAPHVSQVPVLSDSLAEQIDQIVLERQRASDLLKLDLEPSRTILFVGPPGVGKTLTAYWIAERLRKPLFVLDLASVMSSYLGKTGNNLRAVLEYAKANDGVLLLDEFDSLAKRRNDQTEVGELKRLVTVILQEIDRWPADRLLIAATNHGELLDPAIWRRFDAVVEFPMPSGDDLHRLLHQELPEELEEGWFRALSVLFRDRSFSDVLRSLRSARRHSLLRDQPLGERLKVLIQTELQSLPKAQRKALGVQLEAAGVSQRQISEITGLSRDTIRKARDVEVQDA